MHTGMSFSFANHASEEFGLLVYDVGSKTNDDVPFGNKANIVEQRLPCRIKPLHYGVRYHDDPLKFKKVFGSQQYLDRYQLQLVSNWLTGYQDYQWMSIEQPDMEHIQYHCLITELTPITVGWLPVAFEAQIVCDCPYAYSYPFENEFQFDGILQANMYNDSTIQELFLPQLTVSLTAGCRDFSIENRTTGCSLSFAGLPAGGLTINIDNENSIVRENNDEYDLYRYYNYGVLNLASGDNDLLFTGSGTATISGRFLYNVGA